MLYSAKLISTIFVALTSSETFVEDMCAEV